MTENIPNKKAPCIISEMDIYLFHEGRHFNAYNFMGAHAVSENNIDGIRFTTWAPNASSVCVIGDFCFWQMQAEYYMQRISNEGIWSVFIPNLWHGIKYKFAVTNRDSGHIVYKSDPYAISSELRPNTASVFNTQTDYKWNDDTWLKHRADIDIFSSPMNIYELHLGSWKTKNGYFLDYEELSTLLLDYVKSMGYTHVEFMPLNEHPLDASWGYQGTGLFSVNSRHGDLCGLKHLIDNLHNANIGVILDWVPGHFCMDEHGLINFDGSPCYEYKDRWKAQNKGWGTHNFDLGCLEVKSFLISNAMYWTNEFHIDGLRVDAVSNILYLDYERDNGQWQ
ncbi:MAG TPA: alpha-amylase family glycosyl hydrolase, partial [Aquella sp.]|nr:alpha-amylase family glycosyl hydrolase [Aquella sp.]